MISLWYSPVINPGYVYLIKAQSGYHKIGITTDLDSRMYALQRKADEVGAGQLEYVQHFYTRHPMLWEHFLQVAFEAKKVKVFGREWFNLSAFEIAAFCQIPAVALGSPFHVPFWVSKGVNHRGILRTAKEWHERHKQLNDHLFTS